MRSPCPHPSHRVALLAATLAAAAAAQEPPPSLSLERELFQVGGRSHALGWSPDGRWLASGGDRGDLAVLDAASGRVRHLLEASDHWIGAVRFSPDGALLAAAGRDVTVWRLLDGTCLGQIASNSPKALDWSRDGRFLALVRSNGEAIAVAAADLAPAQSFALPDDTAADAVAFSPDGSKLAVGKRSGKTFVFAAATGELLAAHEQPDWVQDLAWLDDGRLLRLGWEGTLRGFGAADVPLGGTAYSMAAQRDGSRVLVRTDKEVVGLAPGAEPWRMDGSGAVALHGDGEQWARALAGAIGIWRSGTRSRDLPGPHRQQPQDAVLTGDGRYAIVVGDDWQAFDAATGARVEVRGLPGRGQLVAHPQGPEFVVLVPAGGGGNAHDLQFWTIQAGDPLRARCVRTVPLSLELRGANPDVDQVQLSPDLRHVTYADQLVDLEDPGRSLHLDRLLINQSVLARRGEVLVARVAMHSHLAGGGGFGTLYAFARDGTLLEQRELREVPLHLATAPGGDRVAVCLHSGLHMVAVPGLTTAAELPWPWRQVLWLDGHHLLGACSDDVIQIGDLRSREIVASLALGSWARSLQYVKDRGLLLVPTQDRTLLVRVALPGAGRR